MIADIKDILEARENRYNKIINLSYDKVIVSLRVNIPGTEKTNSSSEYIISVFKNKLSKVFKYFEDIISSDGHIVLFESNFNFEETKMKCIDFENNDFLGRLVDIDVYFKGISISRKELKFESRNCYLCNNEAHFCIKKKEHSVQELLVYIEKIVYLHKFKEELHDILIDSILKEFQMKPSFGLVSLKTQGIHNDMNYSHFEKSAIVLSKLIPDFIDIAIKYPLSEQYLQSRDLGLKIEDEMFKVTNGVNTHKGLLFALSLLVLGFTNSYLHNLNFNQYDIYVKIIVGDLINEIDKIKVEKKSNTAGERLIIEDLTLGARGEALNGYSKLREFSEHLNDFSNKSLITTFISIFLNIEDTNVIKKIGIKDYKSLQNKVNSIYFLEQNENVFIIDELFQNLKISPGGTADWLILTVFYKILIQREKSLCQK